MIAGEHRISKYCDALYGFNKISFLNAGIMITCVRMGGIRF